MESKLITSELETIYKNFGLSHPIKDLEYLTLFAEKNGHLRDKQKHSYNLHRELDELEMDLFANITKARFAIGQVLLYQKRGLTEFHWVPTEECAEYFRTTNDWLFFYFTDDAYAHLYSSWERIACYLNIFWPLPKRQNIHFYNVIKHLQTKLPKPWPDPFTQLSQFKESDYTTLINQHRKLIVHTEITQSTYFNHYFKSLTDRAMLHQLEEERDSRSKQFIESYQRLLQGVTEMLDLIQICFPPGCVNAPQVN